ncbi:MAG: PhzF family phenazine biosynthesis protein [Candidatus Thorarchaeota archaeon]
MHSIPYVQTSVFVDDRYPFGGNQLATYWDVQLNEALSTEDMQGMTLEMNFSESTFLERTDVEACSFKVRIFTPASEIPFAGHPTLGTSFVLKYKNLIEQSIKKTTLELGVGPIPVEYLESGLIQMKQNKPEFGDEVSDLALVTDAIGLSPEDVVQDFPIQPVSTGFPFLIVPLRNLDIVKKAVPNPQLILSNLKDLVSQEILIFAAEGVHQDSHVHSRMFAPGAGVLEDPATGSAAGPLGAYLEKYKVLHDHTFGEEIRIEQGYEMNRPSQLIAKVPNEKMEQVLVSGNTRLTAEGTFFLP